jgi:uracil-DNA glycosylase
MNVTEEEISRASSLTEIASLVAKCERCPLYKTKTKDVTGIGNPKAEIMFIGEAPGKNEDEQGEPFVGAAGKFLNEMLAGIDLKREDIYIANVLKHRPPSNRDPLPNEAEACWPYLRRQIELINPKLIVFLGRHAMNRFFPMLKISESHGNAFRSEKWGRDQVFLALYHPAAALYNGGMRETLIKDFNKIPKILDKINKAPTLQSESRASDWSQNVGEK